MLTDSYKRSWLRRQVAIAVLGGRCQECNIEDWRALQIQPAGTGCSFFNRVIRDPRGYDLLCANCSQIKRAPDVPKEWTDTLTKALDRQFNQSPLDRITGSDRTIERFPRQSADKFHVKP